MPPTSSARMTGPASSAGNPTLARKPPKPATVKTMYFISACEIHITPSAARSTNTPYGAVEESTEELFMAQALECLGGRKMRRRPGTYAVAYYARQCV